MNENVTTITGIDSPAAPGAQYREQKIEAAIEQDLQPIEVLITPGPEAVVEGHDRGDDLIHPIPVRRDRNLPSAARGRWVQTPPGTEEATASSSSKDWRSATASRGAFSKRYGRHFDPHETVLLLVGFVVFLAAILNDFGSMAQTTGYPIAQAFGSTAAPYIVFFLAVAVVIMEVMASQALSVALWDHQDDPEKHGLIPVWKWLIAAVFLAVLIPGMVIATYQIFDIPGDVSTLALVMLFLSVALHLVLIALGAQLVLDIRYWFHTRPVSRERAKIYKALGKATLNIGEIARLRRKARVEGSELQVGPFSAHATNILLLLFGQDVLVVLLGPSAICTQDDDDDLDGNEINAPNPSQSPGPQPEENAPLRGKPSDYVPNSRGLSEQPELAETYSRNGHLG